MNTKAYTFFAFAFALLNLFALGASASKAPVPGGYIPIKDIDNPHVKSIAEFAVSEYNKQEKANLVLVKVLSGQTQVVAGTNYKLLLETKVKGGGILLKYETVVFEPLPGPNPALKLVSFNAVRKPDQTSKATKSGGYAEIEKPNDDPHLKLVAEFAVYMYNAQNKGSKLELLQILKGYQQIVAGTNYKLVLQTKVKGGGLLLTHKAVVFEGLPTTNPIFKLVSFASAR